MVEQRENQGHVGKSLQPTGKQAKQPLSEPHKDIPCRSADKLHRQRYAQTKQRRGQDDLQHQLIHAEVRLPDQAVALLRQIFLRQFIRRPSSVKTARTSSSGGSLLRAASRQHVRDERAQFLGCIRVILPAAAC